MEFRESSWAKSVAISYLLPITGGEYKSKDWESRNSNVKIKNEKILRACFKVYNDIHLCVVFFPSKKRKVESMGPKSLRFSPRIMRAACGIHCGDLAATLESLLVASSMTDPLMQPHPGRTRDPTLDSWRFGCWGYDLMSRKFFTHATPTLFNAGTPKPQMSSCFLLTMKDDLGRHGNVSGRSDWHVLDDDLCDVDRKIASKASMRPWNSVQLGCRSSWPSRTGEFFPRMYRWFGYIWIYDIYIYTCI